jgi:hypothetical protein
MSGQEVVEAGFLVLFGGYWLSFITASVRRRRAESRARRQVGRAEAAACEAALEDEAFAPEQIREAVGSALRFVEHILSHEPQTLVQERPDARVLRQMAESIKLMARATSRWFFERPTIDILRVVNRPGVAEDRAFVRVRFVVDERVGHSIKFPVLGLDQRWTLGRGAPGWIVLSIDWDPLSSAAIERPSIPSPSADDDRLRELSLAELARADALPPATALDQLVARDAPVYHRVLDLAQVDGRFAPVLIAASVQHIVEAWEEAATGSSQPLQQVSSQAAATALLRPEVGDQSPNLALRDAMLERWQVTDLDLVSARPQIRVELDVSAVRYLWADGAGYVGGSTVRRHTITVTWTLELTDDPEHPWQLLTSTNPAREIPHL